MNTFVPVDNSNPACPIYVSRRISYGWMNLYWYQVRAVGMPLFTGEGWLAPIRYGPGKRHALLYYRFGQAAALRFDKIIEAEPNDGEVAWCLQNSTMMPRIVSADHDRVVLEVFDAEHTTDEEFADCGSETKVVALRATLYGILGPRNDRRDTIEPIK